MKYSSEKIYLNEGNMYVENIVKNINYQHAVILDIGIGNGSNARNLKTSTNKFYGITLSEEEASVSKSIYEKIFIYNLENGLPENFENIKFDLIICSHVIEHIAYPEKLLNDILKYLNTSGTIIVCLPNVMHYQSRIKLVFGNFPNDNTGIWDYTHLRWYTFQTSYNLFSQYFEIESRFSNINVPFGRITKYLPKFIKMSIVSFLRFISIGFFAHEMIYVLKLKNGRK